MIGGLSLFGLLFFALVFLLSEAPRFRWACSLSSFIAVWALYLLGSRGPPLRFGPRAFLCFLGTPPFVFGDFAASRFVTATLEELPRFVFVGPLWGLFWCGRLVGVDWPFLLLACVVASATGAGLEVGAPHPRGACHRLLGFLLPAHAGFGSLLALFFLCPYSYSCAVAPLLSYLFTYAYVCRMCLHIHLCIFY